MYASELIFKFCNQLINVSMFDAFNTKTKKKTSDRKKVVDFIFFTYKICGCELLTHTRKKYTYEERALLLSLLFIIHLNMCRVH